MNPAHQSGFGEPMQLQTLPSTLKTTDDTMNTTIPLSPQTPNLVGLYKYDLIEVKGRGAFGEVWKAFNKETGQIVALKIVNVLNTKQAETAMLELRNLEKISQPSCHPFLACYYGHYFDRVNNKLYIEMEFIDGEDLDKWAFKLKNKTTLSDYYSKLLALTKDLTTGLAFAHSKGLIHRDIKPANILITKQNVPKIVDFGIACSAELCRIKSQSYNKCCPGRAGTPIFMAPETITDGKSYFETDVWSLGATLFYLATGKFAFNFQNINEVSPVFFTIVSDEPERLDTTNSRLNNIVNSSLVKKHLNRISTVQILSLL